MNQFTQFTMCGVNGASAYVNNSSISSNMHVTGYGNVSTVENFNDSSIARKRNLSNQDPLILYRQSK